MVNKNNEEMLRTGVAEPADNKALLEEVRQCFQERWERVQTVIPGDPEYVCSMDFDPIRAGRRAEAVVDMMGAAERLVSEICPDIPGVFNFEEDWMAHNLMPVPAYDYLERRSSVTLACALQILDELRRQGVCLDGDHGLPPLAQMREEIRTPAAWDAVHDTDSIVAMIWTIQHRNDDCTGMMPGQEAEKPDRFFMDQYTAAGKLDQMVVSRRRFEEIMDNLAQESVEQAVALYKATFEDVLERIYRSRAVIAQKHLIQIEQGGDAGERRMELLKFRGLLGSICVTPPEVLAHSMGPDVAEIWADFEIPDPYILCFAFLYLLEIGDDMPWVYSVSLPLMEMCASVLPWGNEQLNKDDDARLDHYLEDTELAEAPGPDEWYAMNYENVDEMDMGCRYSCNLAQLVYRTTEGILPRYTEVVWENPNVHELFGETALRDLNPYTYWMRMIEFNRDENPVFRFASPEEKTSMEEKAEMEYQESLNRQEFLSLRTLVLSLQDGSYEDNVIEEDLCFPCELQKNIAVLGGDEAWVEEIDTMVKSLAFIGEAEDVDPEMICEFDAIWVQINGMSHGDYFKITDLAHDYEIPVMYFSYADAAKCAEQLAFYDMEE